MPFFHARLPPLFSRRSTLPEVKAMMKESLLAIQAACGSDLVWWEASFADDGTCLIRDGYASVKAFAASAAATVKGDGRIEDKHIM